MMTLTLSRPVSSIPPTSPSYTLNLSRGETGLRFCEISEARKHLVIDGRVLVHEDRGDGARLDLGHREGEDSRDCSLTLRISTLACAFASGVSGIKPQRCGKVEVCSLNVEKPVSHGSLGSLGGGRGSPTYVIELSNGIELRVASSTASPSVQ